MVECSDTGDWYSKMNFTCVDAGQLTTTWGGSASLSINIIYCLLALLIALMVPLTLIHCWGKKCRHKKNSKIEIEESLPPGFIGSEFQNSTILHSDELDSRTIAGMGNPSPKIGVYNVKSGSVIHPATVNPHVLRSYSSASSFKPIQVTAPQPFSLPGATWNHSTPRTGRPLNISLDNTLGESGISEGSDKPAPEVDESGYATLILKDEPYYEVPPCHRDSAIIVNQYNLYDPVTEKPNVPNLSCNIPLEAEEMYANSGVERLQENLPVDIYQTELRSEDFTDLTTSNKSYLDQSSLYPDPVGMYKDPGSSSYPDLLQMVGASGPPTPEIVSYRGQYKHSQPPQTSNPDIGQLYAKVLNALYNER